MKRTLIALARALGLSLALAGTADASTLGDIRRRIQQVAAAPVPAPAPAANASILDDFWKSLEQVKKVAAAAPPDANGIQRGHAHAACDVLRNDDVAPQPSAQPKFFKAIEDGKGGKGNTAAKVSAGKDPITGKVLFRPGDMVRCSAWAGDGSHRIPMMSNAKETPALDSVRIMVRGKM